MDGGGRLQQALWIKDPLAIFAEGAERGVVVENGVITELVAAGREPQHTGAAVFDAGDHVVLPGLINTHHHFYQTLTRSVPEAIDQDLFGWLGTLYPIWARLTPEALETAVTTAVAGLLLSGCTTTPIIITSFLLASRTPSIAKSRWRAGSVFAWC